MSVPQLRNPIILVHGFCGFDQFAIGGLTLAQYFPGIQELLRQGENQVFVPWLSPTSSVAQRAAELCAFINRVSPDQPVHIIAHSMGGLDSRYMISRLGMGPGRVLSLTTLGTPHRGTAFADWGISRLERLVKPVLDLLKIPTEGIYDLSTSSCRTFNQIIRDVHGVRYFSVAGQHDGHLLRPEWLLPYSIVLDREGLNDGIVSIKSATWGEQLDLWTCDHLSMINWSNPLSWATRESGQRFTAMVQHLAHEGF